MSYWQQRAVTDVGNGMLNDLMAGRKLTICSAWGGTEKTAVDALAGLTDVSGTRCELGLLGLEKAPEGKMVRVQINNVGIEQGYTLHQIGVYAKLDDGLEQLLFILQDERGVEVPSVSENPSFSLEVQALIFITNDVEIKISLEDSKALATPGMVLQALKEHDADPKAHPGLAEALNKTGDGPPGPDTAAAAGQRYFDSESKKEYTCTGQDGEGHYVWKLSGANEASDLTYDGKPLSQVLPQASAGPPGPDTPASPGQHYYDTAAKKEYVCVGQDEQGGSTWQAAPAVIEAQSPPGAETQAQPGQHLFCDGQEYVCAGQDEEGNYIWNGLTTLPVEEMGGGNFLPTLREQVQELAQTAGSFILMQTPLPTPQRRQKTLYGLIVQDYGGES